MEKSNIWFIFFVLIILLISSVTIAYMIYHIVVNWKNYKWILRFTLTILQLKFMWK